MTVAIYGATGWTGRLVAAALQRHGIPISLCGRDEAKLVALRDTMRSRPDVCVARFDAGRAMHAAFARAHLVINCAGPYRESGRAIVGAAVDSGCAYLDASGEHSYLDQVHREYDAHARDRGVVVCPGFAAKGALGDWGGVLAAQSLSTGGPCDEVAIAYAHGLQQYVRPSAGSVLSAAGQGFFVDGRGLPAHVLDRRFAFPPPFGIGRALLVPGAEDVSLPKHLRVHRVRSYLSLAPGTPYNAPWAELCTTWRRTVPGLSRYLLSRAGRAQLATLLRAPRQSKGDETFAVAIEARRGPAVVRLGISARDAYEVTAEILAYGAAVLLGRSAPETVGVVAPSQLCAPRQALATLIRSGALRVLRHGASG